MSKRKSLYTVLALILAVLLPLEGALAATLKLPSGLKVIAAEAFCGDDSIDEVILPDGLEEIGARAFAESSLSEIVLPDSLTSIGDGAFDEGVKVTANKGTYAYDWAVDNGFIEKESPWTATCSADERVVLLRDGTAWRAGMLFSVYDIAFDGKAPTNLQAAIVDNTLADALSLSTYVGVNGIGATEVRVAAVARTEGAFDGTFTLRLTCDDGPEAWERTFRVYTLAEENVVLPEIMPWDPEPIVVPYGETARVTAPTFADPAAAKAAGWAWNIGWDNNIVYRCSGRDDESDSWTMTFDSVGGCNVRFYLYNVRPINGFSQNLPSFVLPLTVRYEDGETPRLTAQPSTVETVLVENQITYYTPTVAQINDIRLDGARLENVQVVITDSTAPEGTTFSCWSLYTGMQYITAYDLPAGPLDFTFTVRLLADGEVWEQEFHVYTRPGSSGPITSTPSEPEVLEPAEEIVARVGETFTVPVPRFADPERAEANGWEIGYYGDYNRDIVNWVLYTFDPETNEIDGSVFAALGSGQTAIVFSMYNAGLGIWQSEDILVPVTILDAAGEVDPNYYGPNTSTPSEPSPASSTPSEPADAYGPVRPAQDKWQASHVEEELRFTSVNEQDGAYYVNGRFPVAYLYYGGVDVSNPRVEVVSAPEGIDILASFEQATPPSVENGRTYVGALVVGSWYGGPSRAAIRGAALAGDFDFTVTLRVTADGCAEPWEQELRIRRAAPAILPYDETPINLTVGDTLFLPRHEIAGDWRVVEDNWTTDYQYSELDNSILEMTRHSYSGFSFIARESGLAQLTLTLRNYMTGEVATVATVRVNVADAAGKVARWRASTPGEPELLLVESDEPRENVRLEGAAIQYDGQAPANLQGEMRVTGGALPEGARLYADVSEPGRVSFWASGLPAGSFDFTFTALLTCDGCEEPWTRAYRVRTVARAELELPALQPFSPTSLNAQRGSEAWVTKPTFMDPVAANDAGWYIETVYDAANLTKNYESNYNISLRCGEYGEYPITFNLRSRLVRDFVQQIGVSTISCSIWNVGSGTAVKRFYEQSYDTLCLVNLWVYNYSGARPENLRVETETEGLPTGTTIHTELYDGGYVTTVNLYADNIPTGPVDATVRVRLTCDNGPAVWEKEYRVVSVSEDDIVLPELLPYEEQDYAIQAGGTAQIAMPRFADPAAAQAEGWHILYALSENASNWTEGETLFAQFNDPTVGKITFYLYNSELIASPNWPVCQARVLVADENGNVPYWSVQLSTSEALVYSDGDSYTWNVVFSLSSLAYLGESAQNKQVTFTSETAPQGVTFRADIYEYNAYLYAENLPAGDYDFTFTATMTCDGCEQPWTQEFRVRSVRDEDIVLPELLPFEAQGSFVLPTGEQSTLAFPQFADPDTASAEGWYFSVSIFNLGTSYSWSDGTLYITVYGVGEGDLRVYLCNGRLLGFNQEIARYRLIASDGGVVTPSEPVVTPSEPVVTPSEPVVTPSEPGYVSLPEMLPYDAQDIVLSDTETVVIPMPQFADPEAAWADGWSVTAEPVGAKWGWAALAYVNSEDLEIMAEFTREANSLLPERYEDRVVEFALVNSRLEGYRKVIATSQLILPGEAAVTPGEP